MLEIFLKACFVTLPRHPCYALGILIASLNISHGINFYMMTSSNGNIFCVTGLCKGNSSLSCQQVGPILAPWTLLSRRCFLPWSVVDVSFAIILNGWRGIHVYPNSNTGPKRISTVTFCNGSLANGMCYSFYVVIIRIHYSDVIMTTIPSQITYLMIVNSTVYWRKLKKTSKLRVTGICVGNAPGTGEFPVQMASNAEDASIWWRHHVVVRSYENSWYTSNGVIGSP